MQSSEHADAPTRGSTLGRYVVLEPLGQGAMGSVLAAYDPELGRRVALKVVRPEAVAVQGAEAARARLLGEAKALARLAHPNVVRLFDAGVHEGRMFLAMELVQGRTLRQWLAARPRPWRAVVDRLEHAGRGLAAAHALGLVHRDFKPENVLIGDEDERVRVGDFGLACWADRAEVTGAQPVRTGGGAGASAGAEAGTSPDPTAEADEHVASERLRLTAVGDAIGTPAYMAPEQHAGEEADARSDQYAFCLVLYEGLYGRRPFASLDREALAEAKRTTTAVDGGTRGSAGPVPVALRRVIARGLAPSPADRFPSMDALLEAMHGARAAATRVRTLGAAAGVVLLLGGIASLGSPTDATSPCAAADQAPDEAWSDDARRAVERRLGIHLDAAAVTRTTTGLDQIAAAWRAASRSACEATWLRKEQSPERLAARTQCLHAQWTELAATVALLRRADASTAAHHQALVEGLPDPTACDRVEPRPGRPHGAQQDARARRSAELAVLARAERYDEAWDALRAWDAHASSGEAVEADSVARMLWRGRLLTARGDRERGAAAHRDALELARAARDGHGEAQAWIALADTALESDDPAGARFYAQMAAAAAASAGGDPEITARAHAVLGRVEGP